MVEITWTAQDDETLAHASRLVVSGRSAVAPLQAASVTSPQHAITAREDRIMRQVSGLLPSPSALVVAGEPLLRPTLEAVGHDKSATDALIARLQSRRLPGRINLVYTRIPQAYSTDTGQLIPLPELDDLRLSALVDVQLEADASLILPPLPHGLFSRKLYETAVELTKVSIQTFDSRKEMMGYIPATENLETARDLVAAYVKSGVRTFAVDFAGASNQPSLMRVVVRTIRQRLKIHKKAKERDSKYYLHAFNVSTSRKSSKPVAPVTDILTHTYGVDSTSTQMWGGGNLSVDRIRYYEPRDYGAYRRAAMPESKLACGCPVCRGKTPDELFRGSPQAVYLRARAHRVSAYSDECSRIVEKMSGATTSQSYIQYLQTKTMAQAEIQAILADVKEIRAGLR